MTTATTITLAEMTADSKQVYKVGGSALIALAEKYGATSKALGFYRRNPERIDETMSLAVAVTGSKSSLAELQRNTYAAIKEAIRQAQ